jgi:NAD(P)-dependent dehydrogenase (short-subunit alcohol dehydrogenase family)
MRDYYADKNAIVTGAASGIGLALCEALLSLDAKEVVMVDLNAIRLKGESSRLQAKFPGKVVAIETDVSEQEAVVEMVQRAAGWCGGTIDLLFNNAGLSLAKPFDAATDADWKEAFAVNFYGALYAIRAVLPIMRSHGGGHIANTASGIGFVPMPYQSMYSATKAALIGLTCSLRAELWEEKIRLSTVIPGTVATAIWKDKGPPAGAISPAESAQGILEGVAANHRIVIVTNADRLGAINGFHPQASTSIDEYVLDIARRRRRGENAV